MKKIRVACRILCFVLLFGIVLSMSIGQTVLASQESNCGVLPQSPNQDEPVIEDKLELKSPYPVLKEKAGRLFEFQVEMHYQGTKSRVFDLSVITDYPGSYVDILAPFTASDKGIESILLKPGEEYPDIVKVRYNPMNKGQIEPGKYLITLQASSGDIAASIELTAVVTARYESSISTPSGLLSADVTAGKDNHISVAARNGGSVPLENLRFSANVPQGWSVDFTPDIVESVAPGTVQRSEMVIMPPGNTIAGDYEIKVMAITAETLAEMTLRLTVTTPTIWGWIGVLIVVAVIVALAVIFILLGRR